MHTNGVDIIAALIGAALPEILFWHSIKFKLSNAKYIRLIHSHQYWLVTFATLLFCAAGALLWFYGEVQPPKNFLLAGAAFPLLLKKGIAALTNDSAPKLGVPAKEQSVLNDYLSAA
jgi:hypothetical protein